MCDFFRKTVAISAVIGCFFVLSSCSGTSANSSSDRPVLTLVAADFTGPYANDFYNIYSNAQTQVVADAVSDSDLSRQDLTNIEEIYTACMGEFGYKISFDSDMTESLSPLSGEVINAENIDEIYRKSHDKEVICDKKSSLPDVQKLYTAINVNPNQEDMTTIVVKCLVRKGLAPADYSVGEYEYDSGQVDGETHSWIKKIGDQSGIVHSGEEKKAAASTEPIDESKMLEFAQCQNNPLELSSP